MTIDIAAGEDERVSNAAQKSARVEGFDIPS